MFLSEECLNVQVGRPCYPAAHAAIFTIRFWLGIWVHIRPSTNWRLISGGPKCVPRSCNTSASVVFVSGLNQPKTLALDGTSLNIPLNLWGNCLWVLLPAPNEGILQLLWWRFF